MKGDGLVPSLSVWNSILKACAKNGDLEQAEVIFTQMEEAGGTFVMFYLFMCL